jgi:hypothetical protein
MMMKYIKSDLLCIGGLEFRFPESISWPEDGTLSCYHSFLDRPAVPAVEADVINVELKTGIPSFDADRTGIMDSGDGMIWSKSGDVHVVEKVLPHISSEPLWTIKIYLEDRLAELYFSEIYLASEDQDEGRAVAAPRYPLDQHLAMHFLASRQGALIHSAGIGFSGKGFMCSGVSTAGKTTISRLLIDDHAHACSLASSGLAGGRFEVLTDDRVILRSHAENSSPLGGEDKGEGVISNNTSDVQMHGTPWTGEGQYATAGVAPLAAMFFLEKDKEIRADRLSVADAVARMLPVTSVPWFDEELMAGTLKTLEAVAQMVPAYDLHFTKTAETADFIANMLTQ